MSKDEAYKTLKDMGCFEYGETTPTEDIMEIFDIKPLTYPANKKEIQRYELEELTVTGYIRDKLLNEGKYFKGEKDSYRILLPSENAGQIMSLMTSADNKLKRGLKLNKNTPPDYRISPNDEVRAFMKLKD